MQRSLNELEQKINVTFKNSALAYEALTHRSYSEENQAWPFLSNERLEYLGDAVLQFIVTDFLFCRYPDKQEGELTKIRSALVGARMLTHVADELSLSEHLYLSMGIAKASDRTLEDALEALIGAIYQDQGCSAAAEFIRGLVLEKYLDEVIQEKLKDPKTHLQEITQSRSRTHPRYEILPRNSHSDDNRMRFISSVHFDIDGELITEKGEGFSKADAGKNAAKRALEKIEKCLVNKNKCLETSLPLHINEVENPIGYLQEVRAKEAQDRPRYKTVSHDGASGGRMFQVEVYFGNQLIADGLGQRKQEAKRHAARHALIEQGICFG